MISGSTATSKQVARDDRRLEERRKIGAFYTPEPLSQILSDWAIRAPTDLILEPSFGGCGFLRSAQQRLLSLGCREPREHIYGCDIDSVAFEYLADVFQGPVDLDRFRRVDFLDAQPGGIWPRTFSCVLANPPYIPYQALAAQRRMALEQADLPIKGIGGRASLWAYFIAHSLSFLADGGRMAWVLPGAFLQANYAKPIRDYLMAGFARAVAIVVHERIFLDAGADEETVILLAEGFRSGSGLSRIEIGQAETMQSLANVIDDWEAGHWAGETLSGRPAVLSLSPSDQCLFATVSRLDSCKPFGDLASVQIGLVTGANEFFVLSNDGIEAAGLEDSDCTPILAKFAAAPGVTFALTDYLHFLAEGGRGHLVDRDRETAPDRVRAYLDTFPADRKDAISTFRKRKIWSKPDDGKIADAFFPVMHHSGPRLVLNPHRFTNTNTIHRVYFRDSRRDVERQLIVISLLTSFSQLSAELTGRRYGSGVLKHEPREAEQIRLLLPLVSEAAVSEAFDAIDWHLRTGRSAEAMKRADKLIYAAAGISDWSGTSAQLTAALDAIRRRRQPKRG